MNPIELVDDNVAGYVRSILGYLPLAEATLSKVEQIHDQTYVNWIFRADFNTANGPTSVYIRQSRGFVKEKPDIKLDPQRIAFEVTILRLLQKTIPGVNPEVLYFDQSNNVAVLSDIKGKGLLLVHELTQGKAHPETGEYFGRVIATVHGKTKGISHEQVRGSKEANDAAIDFNRGMRTEVVEQRYPDITKKFLAESDKHNQYLVLGDLASKNIFVDAKTVRFLDLERAFIGDAAFDLAFLFCHYLIEVPAGALPGSLEFIENFLNAYKKTLNEYLDEDEIAGIEQRLVKFLGITILYRLNGFYLAVNAAGNKEVWEKKAAELLTGTEVSLIKALRKL